MYHVEIRQFPHNAWRFNLTDAELPAVLFPWVREHAVDFGERKWSPHTAELTILEGPSLPVQQLTMGRGWQAARRQSEEVTARLLEWAREADAKDAAAKAAAERDADEATATPDAAAAPRASDSPRSPVGIPRVATPPDYAADATLGGAPAATAGAPGSSVLSDPLALGVQIAALLGAEPSRLLEAWRAAAAESPGLAPSETLGLAEQQLASPRAEQS